MASRSSTWLTQTTSSLETAPPARSPTLLDGCAQDAATFEPTERTLLFEQFAWTNGSPRSWAVWVGDSMHGLATVL